MSKTSAFKKVGQELSFAQIQNLVALHHHDLGIMVHRSERDRRWRWVRRAWNLVVFAALVHIFVALRLSVVLEALFGVAN